jgi:hypothetical protein
MKHATSRRDFLAASSISLVALAIDPKLAQTGFPPLPTGPAYGRVGKEGLDPGTSDLPSAGEAVLLDGRRVKVRNEAAFRITAGKSVWLSPAADGVLSVLYAEV